MNSMPQRPRRASTIAALLMVIVPAALIVAGLYFVMIRQPAIAAQKLNEQLQAKITGLSNTRLQHKLAPQFADVDNDLIADAPTDAAHQIDPSTLVFSWLPDENSEAFRDDFKTLTDALAKATGKNVTFAMVKSSEEQLKTLRDGSLHVTAFSTGAVPIAVNAAGFVPVGMLANDAGNAKHKMQIIVPAGSAIQGITDLKDHELALTEPSSNSGYKAPIILLANDHDLKPERDYRIRTTQSYETSIAGIAKKQFEAAAVASDVLERAIAQNAIKKDQYRVIFESAEFPSAAIGYAYNLKPEVASKIRETILGFNFKGTTLESRFASSSQTRFVTVNYKNDWQLTRMIDDALGRPHMIK